MKLVSNFWVARETIRGLTQNLRTILGHKEVKLSFTKIMSSLAKQAQIGRYKWFLRFAVIGMIKSGFSDEEIERALCLMLKREDPTAATRALPERALN